MHPKLLKLFILIGCLLLHPAGQLFAQLNVSYQYPAKTYQFSINDLMRVDLQNLSEAQANVIPSIIVTDASGQKVMVIETAMISINGRSRHMLSANSYHITYIHSNYTKYVQLNNRLPSGSYEICLNIECLSGNCREFNERLHLPCRKLQIESFFKLVLNYPVNRSELHDNRPLFNWSLTGQVSGNQNVNYTIEVYEVDRLGAAISPTTSPLIYLRGLTNSQAGYNLHQCTFQKEHKYAWRVTAFIDDEMIAVSETWYFYLTEESLQKKNSSGSYAVMKKKLDAAYYPVIDGNVYFMFAERYYHVDILNISITDLDKKNVYLPGLSDYQAQRPEDSDLPAYIKNTGKNKFVLDLTSLNLSTGWYLLNVKDSYSNEFYLKFKIN